MDIGIKIFKVVAAARRPLTLDELGEAISIIPGDTSWDSGKIVNDVWKSLESCGSFIIAHEVYSTVHFAHSNVRSHLLTVSAGIDDVREYHVDLTGAHMDLGAIAVTYLSFDVFDTQLVGARKSSHNPMINVPSTVIKSTAPKHDFISRTALALL